MSGNAERLARLAERAACGAAAYLARVPRPPTAEWTLKGPPDFVTSIDRTAEAMIRDDLLRAEPDSRVLGEELAPSQGDASGLVWIVDPLDGTTNFLHGYPAWSVSIGAAIDGELVAGTVLHVPTRDVVASGGAAAVPGWQASGSTCPTSAIRGWRSSAPGFRSRHRATCLVSSPSCRRYSLAAAVCGAPGRRHSTSPTWRADDSTRSGS